MEGKINGIINTYLIRFKNDIMAQIDKTDLNNMDKEEFLKFIFDYNILILSSQDFQRRKRVKNVVPHHNRCLAKRANGEQCTRRKKDDMSFCGTHNKGIPHGEVTQNNNDLSVLKKKCIWVEEIKGINYFIDDDNNIYNHTCVLNDDLNPKIIAKYKLENGIYTIPEYEK